MKISRKLKLIIDTHCEVYPARSVTTRDLFPSPGCPAVPGRQKRRIQCIERAAVNALHLI